MSKNYDIECFQTRKVTEKDWPTIHWLYANQEWHQRNLFISELNHCALMVAVDHNDIPISTLSYAIHKKYVNLNSYVTHPDFRGHGVGSALWKHVTEQLGTDKNFHIRTRNRLLEKYKKWGFASISTVTVETYLGFINEKKLQELIENLGKDNVFTIKDDIDNVSVIDKILEYDNKIHEEDNSNFLKVWLKHSQDINTDLYTVYAKNESGHVIGYGSVLLCPKSVRIGPLFADSFEIFLRILQRLMTHKLFGQKSQLQYEFAVPSTNTKAVDFLTKFGFEHSFTLNRCFTKTVQDLCYDKIYCFTIHVGVPE